MKLTERFVQLMLWVTCLSMKRAQWCPYYPVQRYVTF